jgi:hypothetical protein
MMISGFDKQREQYRNRFAHVIKDWSAKNMSVIIYIPARNGKTNTRLPLAGILGSCLSDLD